MYSNEKIKRLVREISNKTKRNFIDANGEYSHCMNIDHSSSHPDYLIMQSRKYVNEETGRRTIFVEPVSTEEI